MISVWFAVVSFMLIAYVVLDGRNFGSGMVQWFVTKTPQERRQVVAAIGPLWSWHEVWLVGFGGTLVAVFPRLMAAAFSGYYLALMLILWGLILRGISLEVAGHINDREWQGFWDFVFAFSNLLLAILFGAAAGNLGRGVPLDASGTFSMAFFTDFQPRGYVGLLDWYTVSVAIFVTVLLAAHGATYLMLKTEGPVNGRSAGMRCFTLSRHFGRILDRSAGSFSASNLQAALLGRCNRDCRLSFYADFGPGDPS
jgi:cytochrome d ubiquinol oxidase subunit II